MAQSNLRAPSGLRDLVEGSAAFFGAVDPVEDMSVHPADRGFTEAGPDCWVRLSQFLPHEWEFTDEVDE